MIEKNYKIIFIPFAVDKDVKIANYLEKKIKNENFIIYEEELTLTKIKDIFNSSQILVGMRLHSIILSYCYNLPFLALPYSSKIENFLDNNDLSDYKIDLPNFNSEELIKKPVALIENEYDDYQEKLLINKTKYSQELKKYGNGID